MVRFHHSRTRSAHFRSNSRSTSRRSRRASTTLSTMMSSKKPPGTSKRRLDPMATPSTGKVTLPTARRFAISLVRRKVRVVAMYSLETLGFYSDEPGSQHYPFPFGLMFSDRGDFVAFVGTTESRALVRESIRSFRSHTAFPTIGGVAPGF